MKKTNFDNVPDGGYSTSSHCTVGAAMAGASIVSGLMASDAASSASKGQQNAANAASNAQLTATRETNQLQQNMYQQNLANLAPSMQAGQTALAALQSGMGLGQLQAAHGTPYGSGSSSAQPIGSYTNSAGQPVDTAGNVISSNGALGPINYGATQEELNQGAGSIAAGSLTKAFAPSDLTTDPSYQWRLSQGLKSLQSSAAARGGLLTGQAGADINNYAQGAASTEYQAAYDRNKTTQDSLYNRLAGLAGIGLTSTAGANQAGQNAANQIGVNTNAGIGASNNWLTSGAAAGAAGQIGSANAWNSVLNNPGTWATLQKLNQPQVTPYSNQVGQTGVVGGDYMNPDLYNHP